MRGSTDEGGVNDGLSSWCGVNKKDGLLREKLDRELTGKTE